jgi:ribonucleoside-diphosphate reductase alpha chain
MTNEERAELNILTVGERLQPTLPGVDESAIETRQGHDVVPDPKSIPSANELAAQMDLGLSPSLVDPVSARAIDAPMCMTCGVYMQRAGSCFACPSCGSTSGCS